MPSTRLPTRLLLQALMLMLMRLGFGAMKLREGKQRQIGMSIVRIRVGTSQRDGRRGLEELIRRKSTRRRQSVVDDESSRRTRRFARSVTILGIQPVVERMESVVIVVDDVLGGGARLRLSLRMPSATRLDKQVVGSDEGVRGWEGERGRMTRSDSKRGFPGR